MAVNKITYGGSTLIDLTGDSVTPETLANGVTAHDKSGAKITGTMPVNGAISKTLDTSATSYTVPKGYTDGGTVKVVTETKTVTPTKSTQNVTPSSGKVLSKVTVNPIPDTYVDASTVATNTKNYEITLAKASGWVLLTTLDAEVMAYINDKNLKVSLTPIGDYAYVYYAVTMAFAANEKVGMQGSYPVYGLHNRVSSSTSVSNYSIFYPANNTGTSTSIGSGQFRLDGSKYYFRPYDGFLAAGTYRLTFTW